MERIKNVMFVLIDNLKKMTDNRCVKYDELFLVYPFRETGNVNELMN